MMAVSKIWRRSFGTFSVTSPACAVPARSCRPACPGCLHCVHSALRHTSGPPPRRVSMPPQISPKVPK